MFLGSILSYFDIRIGHFHDSGTKNTFGLIIKKKYRSFSDFSFQLVSRVICSNPSENGFVISVAPERYEGGLRGENYERYSVSHI